MSKTFSYVKYDEDSAKLQQHFKQLFEQVEAEALKSLTASRPRALVMTALEEAYMWVGKAIRDDQIARDGVGHSEAVYRGES